MNACKITYSGGVLGSWIETAKSKQNQGLASKSDKIEGMLLYVQGGFWAARLKLRKVGCILEGFWEAGLQLG